MVRNKAWNPSEV